MNPNEVMLYEDTETRTGQWQCGVSRPVDDPPIYDNKHKGTIKEECTDRHEMGVHNTDMMPCCRRAREAYANARDDDERNKIKNDWDKYIKAMQPHTEYRAYESNVECATEKLKVKDISFTEKQTLQEYRNSSIELKDENRRKANRALKKNGGNEPECPTFEYDE